MGRFKVIADPYILGVGINQSPIDMISQEEYDSLSAILKDKPTAQEGYRYMLRADTLEWELVEIQPEPEDNPIEPDEPEVIENE